MFKIVKLVDIRPGSKVILREAFGNAAPRTVIVESVEADIKNGRPGIDYEDGWAYLSQIDKVVSY